MGDGTAPAGGESGHDEPLVIDNPAAKVNMGNKNGHTPTSSDGFTWERDATTLNAVDIRQWKTDERKQLLFSFAEIIGPDNLVTIHMAPPNHRHKFEVSQAGSKVVLKASTLLEHPASDGILKVKDGTDLRVKRVISVDVSGNGVGEFDRTLNQNPNQPVRLTISLVREKPQP